MQVADCRPWVKPASESVPSHKPSGDRGQLKCRRIHTYRLKFAPRDGQRPKDIEFRAADAYRAIILIQRWAGRGKAELWCDSRKLCEIRLIDGAVWEIRQKQSADFGSLFCMQPAYGNQTSTEEYVFSPAH